MIRLARGSALVLLMAALLLAGCAPTQRTVGESILAKRQHRSGWHVDLRLARATKAPIHLIRSTADVRLPVRMTPRTGPLVARTPVVHPQPVVPHTVAQVRRANTPPVPLVVEITGPNTREVSAGQEEGEENLLPPQGYNLMGILSLMLVAGAVAAALVTTQTLLVLGMLAVGITLAAIALRRIRLRERQGKGFAVIALVVGCLALLITAVAIVRAGGL